MFERSICSWHEGEGCSFRLFIVVSSWCISLTQLVEGSGLGQVTVAVFGTVHCRLDREDIQD